MKRRAQIVQPNASEIEVIANALRQGAVVGFPTETVYGLAGSVWNEDALAQIFSVKERPRFDPLIIHVEIHSRSEILPLDYLENLQLVNASVLEPQAQDLANKLMQAFWPGPLTLVLPKNSKVPDLATSGLSTVAVRMPRHPGAQALLKSVGFPLAAPSANRFGRISPTSAKDVENELGDRIDWILDGGECEVGLESTILAIESDGSLKLLRAGGIPVSEIQNVSSSLIRPIAESNQDSDHSKSSSLILAPGQLASHYAPRKPLYVFPRQLSDLTEEEAIPFIQIYIQEQWTGWMIPTGKYDRIHDFLSRFIERCSSSLTYRVLSPQTLDPVLGAKNFFRCLRALDDSPADILFAEPWPTSEGLGQAMNDRLQRASTRLPEKIHKK